MPVATQASLKGLSPKQLEETSCRLCLNNTYHLGLKPGQKTLDAIGGAHKLQSWPHNILTGMGHDLLVTNEADREQTVEGTHPLWFHRMYNSSNVYRQLPNGIFAGARASHRRRRAILEPARWDTNVCTLHRSCLYQADIVQATYARALHLVAKFHRFRHHYAARRRDSHDFPRSCPD